MIDSMLFLRCLLVVGGGRKWESWEDMIMVREFDEIKGKGSKSLLL
jgi:hypothetical protein